MSGSFKDLQRPLSLLPSLTGNIKDNGCSLVLDPGGGNKEQHPQTTQFQEIKIVTSCSTLGSVCYHDAPWCILTDTLPFPGLTHAVCPGSFWEDRWRGCCELGQPQGLVTFLECLSPPASGPSLRLWDGSTEQQRAPEARVCSLISVPSRVLVSGELALEAGGTRAPSRGRSRACSSSGALQLWARVCMMQPHPPVGFREHWGTAGKGPHSRRLLESGSCPRLSLGPDSALAVGLQARHQAGGGSWEKDGACWAWRTHSRPRGTEQGAPGPP